MGFFIQLKERFFVVNRGTFFLLLENWGFSLKRKRDFMYGVENRVRQKHFQENLKLGEKAEI